MKTELTDKVAMISGATRGIGRAVAQQFAAEGVNLSLCGRDAGALHDVACEIEAEYGISCLLTHGDLTVDGTIQKWVGETKSKFQAIDILVNNAGATKNTPFDQIDRQVWMDELALKFFAYVELAGAVFAVMKEGGGGSIVNVIGVAATQPAPDRMIGSAAGAALVNFTKSLSNDGAPYNIRVNSVSPGYVRTHRWNDYLERVVRGGATAEDAERAVLAQVPLRRLAEPADIANAVIFLSSSSLAGYITGTTLNVDGGYLRGI